MPAQPARRTNSNRVVTDLNYTLKVRFNKQKFRPQQYSICQDAVDGHDLMVFLPTGYGKSICYQLPALQGHGCTIVISPLISLINDQVENLKKLGIEAKVLNSNTGRSEFQAIVKDLQHNGHPVTRLLYTTPERCLSESFRNTLDYLVSHNELQRIVVDEAHCCILWGNTFRASYRNLGFFKKAYPDIPVTALTASANKKMRESIKSSLKLPDSVKIHAVSCNRPNIHYEVRCMNDSSLLLDDLMGFLKSYWRRAKLSGHSLHPRGIIYVRRRAEAEDLAFKLRQENIPAVSYHAGMTDRSEVVQSWMEEDARVRVIVATIAFGMGIDKEDVRFVIHTALSNNMEEYYQESGRAGRDGRAARCILYYCPSHRMDILDDKESMEYGARKIIEYCEAARCRRHIICEYFDEEHSPAPSCNYGCDYCKNPEEVHSKLKELNSFEPRYG